MLPKKGSRRIVVDNRAYRYVGFLMADDRDRVPGELDHLTIGTEEDRGQILRATVTWEVVSKAYGRAGKILGRFGRYPPFVVRQTIEIGLARGWTPTSGFGLFDLGCVDALVDYTRMSPADAEPDLPRVPDGVTLEEVLTTLVARYGWERLSDAVPIRCFQNAPSVKSSLTFLRRTPWARERVERLFRRDLVEADPTA